MFQVRNYQSADKDDVVRLFLLNTPAYFHPQEQADLEAFLDSEIENYMVVVDNGQLIASGGSNIEDGIGWLSWYIVHPEYQGRGAGRQLALQNIALLAADKRVGCFKVRTSQLVYPFYEKLGYVVITTEKDYWGQGFDLVEMER
jgi:[ribosomal protein S18]-alanine N-acetyltransferase